MLKLLALITFALLAPPVDMGTTTAGVHDVSAATLTVGGCFVSNPPRRGKVTVEVLSDADGDDQQSVRVTIEARPHEDSVDCIVTAVEQWGGG